MYFLHPVAALRLLPTCLIALLASQSVPAATTEDLRDPQLAMTVNERAYPMDVAEILLRAAQLADPKLGWPEGMEALAENQLIAAHARALDRSRRPAASPGSQVPEPQIDARVEDRYFAIIAAVYARALDTQIRGLAGRSIDGLVTWQIADDDRDLEKLRRLQMENETDALLKLAGKTRIATITLPDGSSRHIHCDELYARLDSQSPALLQGNNRDFFKARLSQRVRTLFIDWWMGKRSNLDAQEVALLKTLIGEQQKREDFMYEQGAIDPDSPRAKHHLEQLEKAVTDAEIAAWHQENREQFRALEKVRARHIRCAAETDCMVAHGAVRQGTDFSIAARTFSIADDKNATPPGDMGWILVDEKNNNWLQKLALEQPAGKPTGILRSPDTGPYPDTWEILLVDEIAEGFGTQDRADIASKARREIARQKAVSQYKTLRENLLNSALIRRNGFSLASRLREEI